MKSSSGKRSNRDPPSQMFGDVLEWRTLRIYTTSPATMAQATNTLITIPAMAPPLRPEVPLCPARAQSRAVVGLQAHKSGRGCLAEERGRGPQLLVTVLM